MTDSNHTDLDYQDGVKTAGGLTREMKLLLGALLTLLLASAIAFYFNGRNAAAADMAVTETTTQTTTETTTEVTTVSATNVEGAPGTVSSTSAAPGTIPPLSSAPVSVTDPSKLGGINPDAPLAAVPSRNPFKPFSLAKDGSAPAGAVATPGTPPPAAGSAATSFAEPSVAISAPPSYTPPSSPAVSSRSSSSSTSASTASRSTSGTSGSTTTWVLGPDNTPVTVTGGSSTRTPASTASNTPSSSGRSSSSAGTPAPTASATSGAVVPWAFDNPDDYPEAVPAGARPDSTGAASSTGPVAGVTEPDLGTVASRPADAGTGTPALSVPLPAPGQPDLITQYGNDEGVGAPDNGTALSRTLNRQGLRFNGAVLGPTDTAIFKSNQGFMVLAKGDRLPDTDIVVQQITANSVTLALGQDSLKLELEPLQ
ncbi:hypothetical protein GCM10017783_09460 [Deinococcus piscis]|uniref:Uncharacterized protein n=1 Tax=Deinococcus piscis TaxID=394230 RepID=A0ABQ3K1B6_9DEIO|nr:hypothetical protein [Deinococcus piscis]GHF99506.1 hypothetical protein GCM10017783_09460 [Deinococcus piscis]